MSDCSTEGSIGDMRFLWITYVGSFSVSILLGELLKNMLSERQLLPGLPIGLQLTYNSGVAFGISLPSPIQEVLIIVAILLVGYIALHQKHSFPDEIGFGLLLGGGSANIIDRMLDGRVTDFIRVGSFPIFNIADSCITLGIAILCVHGFLAYRRRSC